MSGIQVKKVARYVMMPEIMPLFKQLFTSGFGHVAFLMAQIYSMVRLLPDGHAYLNPQNIGNFGIRHVIAEAANNLVLSRKNIDQILIFTALLIGIILLALQIALLFFGLVFGTAAFAAGTPTSTALFVTARPAQDIAFMLMDHVFGIPDMFQSCVSTATACEPSRPGAPSSTAFPYPFHLAMHQLFRFYSGGMLAVGTLIVLYFAVVVVAETATTGTPFGQRFQNIWVPIRLIVALGLLVPVNHGLNGSQYIALFSGKVGSSLATNAWREYNLTIRTRSGEGANPTGEVESLLGFPEPPDASPIVQMMSLVHTCAAGYWLAHETIKTDTYPRPNSGGFDLVKPFLVKQPPTVATGGAGAGTINTATKLPVTSGTSYDDAVAFFNNSDIVIRFGSDTAVDADKHTGGVKPYCGDIRIVISDTTSAGATGAAATKIGAEAVQEFYFDLIVNFIWFGGWSDEFADFAERINGLNTNIEPQRLETCSLGAGNANLPQDDECRWKDPGLEWKQNLINNSNAALEANLYAVWDDYVQTSQLKERLELKDNVLDRGWAGAGIWYNTIARVNGAFMDSFINLPQFDAYPRVMEKVREENARQNSNAATLSQFTPSFSNDRLTDLVGADANIAKVLGITFLYWNRESVNLASEDGIFTSSGLEGAMNMIFGTQGLFSMTRNNNQTHPLAQLAMLGKGLVEASVRNVAAATIGSGVGGLFRMIDDTPGALIEAVSGFMVSTAFVGLTAGIVLFYIVPFLPFVYFFFAVAEWVKAIFEAMVGAPLWALAHLRIDGDGLPGSSAANGYYLILEIAIRPILTVFGLVAATLIFTAQLRILNFLWLLVTENLAGFNEKTSIAVALDQTIERGVIDNFFFTVIYAIVAYMMALAAFKLINKIPDNILRWIGASVSSFGDINEDPTDGLTRYAALGGVTAGQSLVKGVSDLGGGLGNAVSSAVKRTGQGGLGS